MEGEYPLESCVSGAGASYSLGGSVGTICAAGDVTRRINGNADITLAGGTVDALVMNNMVGGGGLGAVSVS